MMYAPRVFISMIGALVVFAIVTYGMTGSLWTTFIQTLVCAVLVQIGYFIAVLALVWKAGRDRKRESGIVGEPRRGEESTAKHPVTRLDKPGHSNL